jgi:hypothetical protein
MNKKSFPIKELEEFAVESPVVEKKVAEVKPKKLPEPLITFNQYFRLLKKPPHHAAGMHAYAKTGGKRTKSSWDTLFAKY